MPISNVIKSQGVIFVVIIVLISALFYDTNLELHRRWIDIEDHYNQGYLVLLAFLVLGYQRLSTIEIKTDWLNYLGFCGALVFLFLWLASRIGNIFLLQQLSIIGLIASATVSIYGRASLLPITPLLLFLTLACTAWNYIGEPLRDVTTIVTKLAYSGMNLPLHFDQYAIYMPDGVVKIASGCSGLSYFLVSLAIFSYLGLSNNANYRQGLTLLLMGLTVGLFTNWIRVIALVGIAYYSNFEHQLVHDHNSFGWLLYAGLMFPAIWLVRHVGLRKAQHPQPAPETKIASSTFLPSSLISIGIITVAAYCVFVQDRIQTNASQQAQAPNSDRAQWLAAFHHYDYVHQKAVIIDGVNIEQSSFDYNHQTQGKELVGYDNTIADGTTWIETSTEELDTGANVIGFSRLRSANQKRRIVYWWYQIGETRTASSINAKLSNIIETIKGRPKASLITISAQCLTDCLREEKIISENLASLSEF